MAKKGNTAQLCLLLILLLASSVAGTSMHGQLLINEIMASNASTLEDQYNNYPDWIEIYNPNDTAVLLSEFWLSDDSLLLKKWNLPDMVLPPNSYFVVFASGMDVSGSVAFWHTAINTGEFWKYTLPDSAPGEEWKTSSTYTSAWETGKSGIGYSDNDDSTLISATLSLYMQKEFQIESLDEITDAILFMDYDDGFIAYLNGTEIARSSTMGSPGTYYAFNQSADGLHEAQMYNGGQPEEFSLSNHLDLLKEGSNILAIQVHNTSIGSSDMSANPFLLLGLTSIKKDLSYGNPYIIVADRYPHANFKIRSSGEFLYLSNNSGDTVDVFEKVILPTDFSYGRVPLDTVVFGYYDTPTPGSENGLEYSIEYFTDSVTYTSSGKDWDSFQIISLESDRPEDIIYFTSDGSWPDATSEVYADPIPISATTVIRARIQREGNLPGPVSSKTVFVGSGHELPVVSVTLDPFDLWDFNAGIYEMGPNAGTENPYFGANFWQDWEKPAHVAIYDKESNLLIDQDAGVKIYGAWSRARPQKSMAFFARKSYGKGSFSYPLFTEKPIENYENFVLRNGGNDYHMSMIRDALSGYLSSQMNLDHQGYEPYVMYLNGDYWGMMNMREKINEHFIAGNHNVYPEDVNLLERNSELVHGSAQSYIELINFISNHDFRNTQNYANLSEMMDIQNFISFWALNVFIDNKDWPGNNNKFWSLNAPGSKYRWISFDTDFGYSLYDNPAYPYNTLQFSMSEGNITWANPDWATLIIRKLEQNDDFRWRFINEFADRMNTIYHPDHILPVIDSFQQRIQNDVAANFSRWEGTMNYWQSHLNRIRVYFSNRPNYMRIHLMERYDITGTKDIEINISSPSAGFVNLNGMKQIELPFAGVYFQDVPIELEALPMPGYAFSHWEGALNSGSSKITYDMAGTGTASFSAVFEADEYEEKVVINEINYASSLERNTEDWVELYNHSNGPVNLKDWSIWDKTSGNEYLIREHIIVQAGEYYVFSRSLPDFKRFYPELERLKGNLPFGFDNINDGIALIDALGNLHDVVDYTNTIPWPEDADASGATLELIDPDLDNTIPENWKASKNYVGTPGEKNSQSIVAGQENKEIPADFAVRAYPSPFSDYTTIEFELDKENAIEISIYSITGKMVERIDETAYGSGTHSIRWKPSDSVSPGIYLLQIQGTKRTQTLKLVYR